jgi:hypothetical protein
MFQHYPFQGPPKYTKVRIFVVKIHHLATLLPASVLEFTTDGKCAIFSNKEYLHSKLSLSVLLFVLSLEF